MLAANLLSFCLAGLPLSAEQFDREISLLERLAQTASPAFEQEGTRARPVVQAVLTAFDEALEQRRPVFDSEMPSRALADRTTGLVELLASLLASDLLPGESETSCRSPRLAVAAGWWLPVAESVYGFPGTAQLVPSAQMLEQVQPVLLPFGHPRLGPYRLLPTWSVASNYSLHAVAGPPVLPSSWSLRVRLPVSSLNSGARFEFAVGSQPVVCAALEQNGTRWNETACGRVLIVNATHVSCTCLAFSPDLYYAALPLAVLITGASESHLIPALGDGSAVPTVPTLAAGLALAAMLLLALAALLFAWAVRRGLLARNTSPMVYVSPGVPANAIVPADNRIRVPLPLGSAATGGSSGVGAGLVSGSAYAALVEAGKPKEEDNIWVSDEDKFENVEDPLISEDMIGDDHEDGFHDANAPLW